MEAFFLGETRAHVFVSYHAPTGADRDILTVICPPLFSEFMRSQLAIRDLAVALAENGQHVLRFDYGGTGDSYGEVEEFALSDWVADAQAVIEEGRDLTSATRVNLLGVRFGCVVACRAAETADRVVLWDPIPDGRTYLRTIRSVQQEMLDGNPYLVRAERQLDSNEVDGQILDSQLIEDLAAIKPQCYAAARGHAVIIVSSEPMEVPGVELELVKFDCAWAKGSDDLMMPRPVLEKVVLCLS